MTPLYSQFTHSIAFLSLYTFVFTAHAANKSTAEAANKFNTQTVNKLNTQATNKKASQFANKNTTGKKSYREIQSQNPPYKILTLKGKVVSFDDKNVVLDVDGRKAKIARAAFPSSQKFIYNEMATAYFRLEI